LLFGLCSVNGLSVEDPIAAINDSALLTGTVTQHNCACLGATSIAVASVSYAQRATCRG